MLERNKTIVLTVNDGEGKIVATIVFSLNTNEEPDKVISQLEVSHSTSESYNIVVTSGGDENS